MGTGEDWGGLVQVRANGKKCLWTVLKEIWGYEWGLENIIEWGSGSGNVRETWAKYDWQKEKRKLFKLRFVVKYFLELRYLTFGVHSFLCSTV